MRRNIILVVIQFFYILAMVAIIITHAKQPFFKDTVFPIPQSYCKAKVLKIIRYTRQPVFAPAVSPVVRLVKREVAPGIAVRPVIFPYSTPLPLTEIRPPLLQRYRFFIVYF